MKKKIFLIIVILLILSAGAFAQEKERTNSTISLSFGLIGAELSYEYMFNRFLSVMLDASATTMIFVDEFTFSGKGRLYPFGRAFYLELGLGYVYGRGVFNMMGHMLLGVMTLGLYYILIDDLEDDHRTGGFLIQPGLGWKIDIGKPGGFVLPIGMGVDIKVNKQLPDFMPFLRIGLGYSF